MSPTPSLLIIPNPNPQSGTSESRILLLHSPPFTKWRHKLNQRSHLRCYHQTSLILHPRRR
ncbi:hypothetical protein HanIR_Chr17g0867331 [Helianthus annuus]|nr:hypothetical protein HanIR_Chr17g0867331 [Helianthus annuus]